MSLQGRSERATAQLREATSAARKLTRGILPVIAGIQSVIARCLEVACSDSISPQAWMPEGAVSSLSRSVAQGVLRLAAGESVAVLPLVSASSSDVSGTSKAGSGSRSS